MTKFEANLVEQKYINERGEKSLLKNEINAMNETKFCQMKQLAQDDPALFKQLYDPDLC